MADPCTKFDVSIISHCRYITLGVKFYKGSPDPDHTPFQGRFFIGRVGLAVVNQFSKVEVSRFACYEAMNGGAKCRKWGGLGQLGVTQGQLPAMPPFDRAHTTSYST